MKKDLYVFTESRTTYTNESIVTTVELRECKNTDGN